MNTITHIISITALTIASFAGTASALAPEDNPLGGPKQDRPSAVERTLDANDGFGNERNRRRPANEQSIMGAALRSLNAAADEALHLTDAQREMLDEIRTEFEASVRQFREANGETIQALREEGRALREAVQAGDETAREQFAQIREKMTALRENAPSFADIRESMQSVLTQDQQQFVANAMDEIRNVARDRGERARRGNAQGPLEGMGAMEDMDRQRPTMGDRNPPESALQLRELAARLQGLPEADRTRIVELIEAMISKVEADNGIDPKDSLKNARQRGQRNEQRERNQTRQRNQQQSQEGA